GSRRRHLPARQQELHPRQRRLGRERVPDAGGGPPPVRVPLPRPTSRRLQHAVALGPHHARQARRCAPSTTTITSTALAPSRSCSRSAGSSARSSSTPTRRSCTRRSRSAGRAPTIAAATRTCSSGSSADSPCTPRSSIASRAVNTRSGTAKWRARAASRWWAARLQSSTGGKTGTGSAPYDLYPPSRRRRCLLIRPPVALEITLVAALIAVSSALSAPHAAPTVNGTVGPGFTITLKSNGSQVKSLKAGSYSFVVADKASIHNFVLEKKKGGTFEKELTS